MASFVNTEKNGRIAFYDGFSYRIDKKFGVDGEKIHWKCRKWVFHYIYKMDQFNFDCIENLTQNQ